ncbi:hypothetical protein K443DRAFT_2165 [Laccaria amethystina LaAM-08-1]|uniref:Aminopeptidase P N-terminal domain-containing protein n=1 Tax=Laccaria amethystina LaAM-08-1 TaxID=1095629 RepID=A0A0C9Y150_9AGAR|nr:hypothetical protein K443DRAFT_2165 [Laccaria amethystina LaAM-08-1]
MFITHLRVTTRSYTTYTSTKPSKYGQPLLASHPHLFKQNDLTPGIPSGEYKRRRKTLMNSLPDNSAVISIAAPVKYMSSSVLSIASHLNTNTQSLLDIFYKYRQASDFWYLTGFEESDAAVVLEKDSSPQGYKMTLFASGKDPAKEKWDGARTSLSSAKSLFGVDSALPITDFRSQLKSLSSMYSNIYVDLPPSHSSSSRRNPKSIFKYFSSPARAEYDSVLESISSSRRQPLAPELASLRAVKSEAEQKVMHAAATISGRAHAKTMRFTRPGMTESALAAHFEYICALSGSQRPAYVPVVASGANALIIHYTANNHLIEDGELVLVDAGCEYNGYASDITRTYPSSGIFSEPQKDLYTAVLTAQKQMITLCHEGSSMSLYDLHRESSSLLRRELNQIGFNLGMEGDLERVLYPHFLSHPIGIDLHESTNFDRTSTLKAGNVITVEPGIYVPPTANFPKHYHNLGIRIEDEVLTGKHHPTVLSASAPKEIADIEGACQGLLGFEPY